MTPFQEFRLWARRAPVGQRIAASIASMLALALLVFILVPSSASVEKGLLASGEATSEEVGVPAEGGGVPEGGDEGVAPAAGSDGVAADDTTGTTDGGETAPGTGVTAPDAPGDSGGDTGAGAGSGDGPAAAGGSDAAAPGGTRSGSAPGGAAPAPSTAPRQAAKASCPPGSAPGVTGSEIKVAVITIKIVGPAGNSVFGIASPEQQRGYFRKIFADANARGGAGCRKLVPTYYEGNPADRNELQRLCLEIEESKPFAVLDAGAYAAFPVVECYPRKKIPYFGSFLASEAVRERSFPYFFQSASADQVHKDTIFALRDRGFFKSGFSKLAFPYRTCDPNLIKSTRGWLAQAGVSKSQIVEYDFGCPNGLSSPSDLQQAVLTFQRAGVTHLTYAGFVGDFGNFTRIAEQQRFKPIYGLPNDALIPLSKGSGAPDANNIANAIAISASRDGEESTPGSQPTAGTVACNKVLGQDVYKIPAIAGNSCNLINMFKAAVDNAPTMSRSALAAGLQRAKSVEFSFPQGPNDFTAARTTTGGQFWRPTQFTTACRCWRVLDRAFKPSYR